MRSNGKLDRSTRPAHIGKAAAFLFVVWGMLIFSSSSGVDGLGIVFICGFLLKTVKERYVQTETTAATVREMRVSELMSSECMVVNRGMNLREFVDVYLLKTSQRCFAVNDHGRFVGLISRTDVGAIPNVLWNKTTIGAAMHPLQALHAVTPHTSVLEALRLALRTNEMLPVIGNGVLKGILLRSELMNLLRSSSGPGSGRVDARYHMPADSVPKRNAQAALVVNAPSLFRV